jgi:hypothetical protein
MRRFTLATAAAVILGGFFSSASIAAPPSPQDADPHTRNLHEMGHERRVATFEVPEGQRRISSDLAFQGKFAYQGTYDGFRVVNISAPGNPKLVSEVVCNGDQGDVVVWDRILVRSWNTKRTEPRECAGTTVPAGFEGVHIFDISNPASPQLLGALELPCGSHTVTVAGVDGGDLIVYSNNSSSAGCGVGLSTAQQNALGDFMDIIAVPLANPAAASLIHREPLAGPTDPAVRTGCHDAGVILGGINRAVCASADTINVFDISNPRDPSLLFTITEPGVGDSTTNGRWHSGTFTWDGRVIVADWEPGGGAQAECEAGDPAVDKSLFFYDAATGAKLGQWVLPRAQGADENCTIHNYNIVPLRSGRYVVVSGNYQAGTWVTDFTDPANPRTVAWSDPASLGPGSFCTDPPADTCQLGGAWSTYWYNNFIYMSDITAGLRIFKLSDKARAGAIRLDRLNPQTQEALPR